MTGVGMERARLAPCPPPLNVAPSSSSLRWGRSGSACAASQLFAQTRHPPPRGSAMPSADSARPWIRPRSRRRRESPGGARGERAGERRPRRRWPRRPHETRHSGPASPRSPPPIRARGIGSDGKPWTGTMLPCWNERRAARSREARATSDEQRGVGRQPRAPAPASLTSTGRLPTRSRRSPVSARRSPDASSPTAPLTDRSGRWRGWPGSGGWGRRWRDACNPL
jgi:hypothetical protein